eukprot:m.386554 g.386554  ORF g.386554 m.386554 type:complete len:486 (-) comp21016_c0_seq1:130-1587(-)
MLATPPRPAGAAGEVHVGGASMTADGVRMASPGQKTRVKNSDEDPSEKQPTIMPPSRVLHKSDVRLGRRARTKSFPGLQSTHSRPTGVSKKGKAGGGKGTWGKWNDDLVAYDGNLTLKSGDPNYDEEAATEDRVTFVEIGGLSEREMQEFLEPKLQEFFQNEEFDEVLSPIRRVADGILNSAIISFILREAIDRDSAERELASRLLLRLVLTKTLNMSDVQEGFDRLLNAIPDVTLDTPDADQILGKFFARAVADEILAPSFITRRDSITGTLKPVSQKPNNSPEREAPDTTGDQAAYPDKALSAIKKAKALIKSPQGLERLVHIWGANGAHSPMDELVNKIQQFLSEYHMTGDLAEAALCVRELRATSFHHQVVYEAVLLVIDGYANERTMLRMSALLRHLTSTGVISELQLEKGIQRVLDSIADIQLDAPRAILFLDSLCRLSQSFFPASICATVEQMSDKTVREAKGRRRTISENIPAPPKY